MSLIATVVLPVFGLVLLGYAVARMPVLDQSGVRGLAAFVGWIGIPALLFRTTAVTAPHQGFEIGILVTYFGGCAVVAAAAMAVAAAGFRLRFDALAIFGMGSTYSNTVLLGLPLVQAAFGDAGIAVMLRIIALHSALLIPATSLLVELGRGGAGAWWRLPRVIAGAVLRNPIIVALLLGLAWRLGGQPLPVAADRLTEMLAGTAGTLALFALGASLAGYRLTGNLAQAVAVTTVKLVVHPAATWLIAARVMHLAPLPVAIATLSAALPTGANVFILARQYDCEAESSASATVISTALSAITLSLLIPWLRTMGAES